MGRGRAETGRPRRSPRERRPARHRCGERSSRRNDDTHPQSSARNPGPASPPATGSRRWRASCQRPKWGSSPIRPKRDAAEQKPGPQCGSAGPATRSVVPLGEGGTGGGGAPLARVSATLLEKSSACGFCGRCGRISSPWVPAGPKKSIKRADGRGCGSRVRRLCRRKRAAAPLPLCARDRPIRAEGRASSE